MSTTVIAEPKPVQPPVEKIRVKVDGIEVEVPRTMPDPISGRPLATTMIQACAAAKVDVPHYCYHPKLPVAQAMAGRGDLEILGVPSGLRIGLRSGPTTGVPNSTRHIRQLPATGSLG